MTRNPQADTQQQKPELWTTAQLRRQGKSSAQIAAAVNEGKIHRVIPGVYSTESPTDLLKLQVLSQRRRRGVTYTGITAAQVYGLGDMVWPATGRVDVKSSRDGGELLVLSVGAAERAVTVGGVSVTSPPAGTERSCGPSSPVATGERRAMTRSPRISSPFRPGSGRTPRTCSTAWSPARRVDWS